MSEPAPGRVALVGAGPWAPGLLTLRGAELLAAADLVLYDHLANPALLDLHCRPASECERVFVGKRANRAVMGQEEIHERMIEAARAGRAVVRVKGGDPFLFGRGGEEGQALADAGVAYEIVPGVTSALAGPAFAGIPLTDRRSASSIAIVTGHERAGGDRVDLAALAAAADTLVFLMGVLQLRDNLAALIAGGLAPDTPAALVRWATRPDQRTVTATAATLADAVEGEGIRPPAVVVVGEVVGHREALAWFERRPLFGRTVAVTRPAGRGASTLLGLLEERGAAVVHTPAIELRAAPDTAAVTADLAGVDWLILTSRNAVRFFAEALTAARLDARALAGARLACVGPATAEAAWNQLRLRADLLPAGGDYRAAALAEALVAEGVAGKRILHPVSAAAPPDLADALRAAGADVIAPAAYTPAPLDVVLPDAVDTVVFASGSAVDATVASVGAQGLRSRRLAAIGPVTAAALERHGLTADVRPARSTAQGLVDALLAPS